MDKQKEFEELLSTCKNALERLVFYKVNNKTDGEGILPAKEIHFLNGLRLLFCR